MKEKIYKLLRWSERLVRTDMLYLLQGGSWLTLGTGISVFFSFLLSIAFANLLPKEIYGEYRFVLSIAGILAVATLSGMNKALTRAVAKGFDKTMVPALRSSICWGTLGGVASVILALYYYTQGNTELFFSFIIAAPFLPLMDSFTVYKAVLNGQKRFKDAALYKMLSNLVAFIVMLATLFLTDSLYFILAAYFIPWTLMHFIFLRITTKKCVHTPNIDQETVPYGKHLTLMGILGTVATNIDKILLFHFLGAADVAIYSIAIAIPENIKGALRNITTLALPKFANRDIGEIKSGLIRKSYLNLAALVIITALYIATAPIIFKLFFPAYIDAVMISQIFAISILTIVLFLPISVLEAHKKTKELYFFKTITSGLQIISTSVLVPLFGIWGAIIARIFTRACSLFFAFVFISKIKE